MAFELQSAEEEHRPQRLSPSDPDALYEAVRCDDVEHVRSLLQRGRPTHGRDEQGRTPLSYAAASGHSVVVVYLLESGADASATDNDGKSALSYAVGQYAVGPGHAQVVTELLAHKVGGSGDGASLINANDSRGRTALVWAAMYGHVDMVHLLIARGAVVETRDRGGMTALMYAARQGYFSVVQELIRCGADTGVKDNRGTAALSWAACRGRASVVQELVRSGAVIDAADNNGQTALSYAAENGDRDVVADFIRCSMGFDESTAPSDGHVALFTAAAVGDVAAVEELFANGTSVDFTTTEGRTPLFYAAEFGQTRMVQFLLECRATLQTKSSALRRGSETALTLAGRAGHMENFHALVEAGASVNVRSEADGETPLISAARWNYFAGVRLMVL